MLRAVADLETEYIPEYPIGIIEKRILTSKICMRLYYVMLLLEMFRCYFPNDHEHGDMYY